MSDETWVVSLPKLGESVTEGVIGSVFKQVGDEVEFDDPLFEVSTDKVDSEVPSPYDGVILEVLAQPGDTVAVGDPVLKIGGKGATVENRLPSAAHGVAAAGGRSLSDASAPSMGGSEGPTTEDAHFAPTGAGEVFEVTMPKLGESVTEGTIGTWLKAVGDDVAFDDPLFDVSTDKVDSEIPSPYDGTLLDILVGAGETVPVGTVLARIGVAGSAVVESAGNGAGPAQAESPRAASPATVAAAGYPRCRRRTAVVAIGAQARRRARHRRDHCARNGCRWTYPARGHGKRDRRRPDDQPPLRPGPRRRPRRRPHPHPGRPRPPPTAGPKRCRSAECA